MVKLIMAILLLCFLPLPTSFAVSAEIYKWKDKDGNIFFSDTPPPTSGVDVEIKKFKEDSTERPKGREDTSKPQGKTLREKRSSGNINVVMYMTPWCGYCRKARDYIHSLNVNLIEYNIEKDKNKREEMLSKSGGSTGVPLIDVEGIIIKGDSPDAIKVAVEKRRNL